MGAWDELLIKKRGRHLLKIFANPCFVAMVLNTFLIAL